jgi:hypothetical protein
MSASTNSGASACFANDANALVASITRSDPSVKKKQILRTDSNAPLQKNVKKRKMTVATSEPCQEITTRNMRFRQNSEQSDGLNSDALMGHREVFHDQAREFNDYLRVLMHGDDCLISRLSRTM